MSLKQRVAAVGLVLALPLACGAPARCPEPCAGDDMARQRLEPPDPVAREQFDAVTGRYARTARYEDTGTLVVSSTRRDGISWEMYTFDTAFVRNRGCRVRVFDQLGALRVALWCDGSALRVWEGQETRGFVLAGGSGNIAVQLALRLLNGRSALRDPLRGVTFGWLDPTCSTCARVVLHAEPRRSIAVRIAGGAVRAYEERGSLPGGTIEIPEGVLPTVGRTASVPDATESVTAVYAPRFDEDVVDPAALDAAVLAKPW